MPIGICKTVATSSYFNPSRGYQQQNLTLFVGQFGQSPRHVAQLDTGFLTGWSDQPHLVFLDRHLIRSGNLLADLIHVHIVHDRE